MKYSQVFNEIIRINITANIFNKKDDGASFSRKSDTASFCELDLETESHLNKSPVIFNLRAIDTDRMKLIFKQVQQSYICKFKIELIHELVVVINNILRINSYER